jgi:hypothetical protein
MSNFKFYTYAHYKADTKEIFYIGKGSGNRAFVKHKRSIHWNSIVDKHGLHVEILAKWETEDGALTHEKFLISTFRSMGFSLCNMTEGGDGITSESWTPELRQVLSKSRLGKKLSDETRKRMSISATGRPMSKEAIEKTAAFHRGRKRGEETLRKMSESLKGKNLGRVWSKESKDKISALHKGSKRSEESKAKMSAAAKGKKKKPQSDEHKRKISEKRKAYWVRWREEKALASLNKHDLESR